MSASQPPRAFPPQLPDDWLAAVHADADWLAQWVGVDPVRLRVPMTWAAEDVFRGGRWRVEFPARTHGSTGESLVSG